MDLPPPVHSLFPLFLLVNAARHPSPARIGPVGVAVQWLLYNSRKVLQVGYLMLALVTVVLMVFLGFMVYESVADLFREHMVVEAMSAKLIVLALEVADYVMIANVLFLIYKGSEQLYVTPKMADRVNLREADRPLALQHMTPTTLKANMAKSLVGVTSVLMVTFAYQVHADSKANWYALVTIIAIHVALTVSMFAFHIIGKDEAAELAHAEAAHAAEPERPGHTPHPVDLNIPLDEGVDVDDYPSIPYAIRNPDYDPTLTDPTDDPPTRTTPEDHS